MRFGIAQALEAAASDVAALHEIDPAGLTGAELAEHLPTVHSLVQQLLAYQSKLVGEFDARGVCREYGALSTKAWLEHALRLSPGDALIARRAGRTVREVPALAAAFV